MHAKIKELEDLAAQTILAEVHISTLASDLKPIANPENGHQLDFTSLVYTPQTRVKAALMTDTGASGRAFVNRRYAKLHKFPTARLQKSIKLRLTDDKLVPNITHMTQLTFSLNGHIDTC